MSVSKLQVVVDGMVFENNYQIGIWRMFYEIMRRLADRVDFTLWTRAPVVQPVPRGVAILRDNARWYGSWRQPGKRWRAEWSRRRPQLAPIRAANVFHPTYFTGCPVNGPSIVTSVYDMVPELACTYSGNERTATHAREKRTIIESSRICTAISNATADDLVKLNPSMAGRIRVITLGSEHLQIADALPEKRTCEQYALFVGNRETYKNFIAILEGLNSPKWPAGLMLRVVGAPFTELEQQLIAFHGLRERIFSAGRVSDAQLANEYAAAMCLIFPSRLEGFGLPVLEAQANGCPVVCSDIFVFHEVAGDAAIFFDSRLGERLAEAVAEVCNPNIRNRLIEAGYKNIGRFSWDRAAEQMFEVYQEAAAGE